MGVYTYDILGAYGGRLTPPHWASHPYDIHEHSYDIHDYDPILNVMQDPRHLAGVHPPEYHPLTREVELVEGTIMMSWDSVILTACAQH